jgi:hypothetical protein
MGVTSLEVAEIFRRYGDDYREIFALTYQQRRVMRAIELCRTEALGGHLYVCDQCAAGIPIFNSCGNRHCPKCQSIDKERWLEARARDVLPVGYFHVVFTVPDTLHALFRGNPRLLYGLLFKASSETLAQIAADPRHLGARIGFLGILHSWGSTLAYHPHVHYVVPAGGLSPDSERWIHSPSRFLLPVEILSAVFRGKFVDFLQRAWRQKKLELDGPLEQLRHPVLFEDLIDQLYRHNWVVYAKEPFAGPEKVLHYLARYTHRVAISNDRLLAIDDDQVVFRYKDYAQGGVWRPMSLAPTEFIRRFMQHVLPRRFVRIRYFGLLANRTRKADLERARTLLKVQAPEPATAEREPWQEFLHRLTGTDPARCPRCGEGTLHRHHELPKDDFAPQRGPPATSREPP